MLNAKHIAYYRVSTQQQGQSGLGLDAQREAVAVYMNTGGGRLIGEFTEIETGKGSNALDRRPQLRAALDRCRALRAVLVIAKLDRLARNVHFVSGLIESGVEFVAADAPHANKTMLQIFAVMGEWERDQISRRTREALAAAKARGVRLGTAGRENLADCNARRSERAIEFAARHQMVLRGLAESGLSRRAMIAELNKLGIAAPRGGKWHLPTLQRVLSRL